MDKKAQVLNRIGEIFRKELEDDSLNLTYSSSTDSIEKWDSVNNLVLISAIEEEFEISFPIEVIFESKNIGDLCDHIVKSTSRI